MPAVTSAPRTALCALSVVVAFAAAPTLGHAQSGRSDGDSALDAIREHIQFARYDDAASAAQALVSHPGLDARTHNTALELLATAHIAAGRSREAAAVLEELYERDPDHVLSDRDASPRVQSAFARAREQRGEAREVVLQQRATVGRGREAPLVEVRLPNGDDTVDEVHLAYRQGDESEYTRVVMTRGESGIYHARIPVLSIEGPAYSVAYYVEALAPSTAVLGRVGSASEPLALEVPAGAVGAIRETGHSGDVVLGGGPGDGELPPVEDEHRGIVTRWWFWTLVVLAIGGGVTAAILLGPAKSGPPDGSLGSMRLAF